MRPNEQSLAKLLRGLDAYGTLDGTEKFAVVTGSGSERVGSASPNDLATTIKVVSGAAYTLLQSDNNKILSFSDGCTVTVPADLTLPYAVGLHQGGASQVTVDPDIGVTVNEPDSQFLTEKRYVTLLLQAFASNTYVLSGRTAA